jgi:hypothetical protein
MRTRGSSSGGQSSARIDRWSEQAARPAADARSKTRKWLSPSSFPHERAALRGGGGPRQLDQTGDEPTHLVARPRPHERTALDVGKQERHGPRWHPGNQAAIVPSGPTDRHRTPAARSWTVSPPGTSSAERRRNLSELIAVTLTWARPRSVHETSPASGHRLFAAVWLP